MIAVVLFPLYRSSGDRLKGEDFSGQLIRMLEAVHFA